MPPGLNLQRSLSSGQLDAGQRAHLEIDRPAGAFKAVNQTLSGLCVKAPKAVSSALGRVRSDVIRNQQFSIERFNQQAASLQRRQALLNLSPETQPFYFEKVELRPSLLFNTPPSFLLPKPLDVGKKLLSQEYLSKYGVHINALAQESGTARDFAEQILGSLNERSPEPVGFVVPFTFGKGPHNTLHYRGHVLAFAAQKTERGLEIFNLDTLAQDSLFSLDLVQDLTELAKQQGLGDTQSFLVKDPRQADKHSCHTDAYQVLKDLLVLFKQSRVKSLKEVLLTPESNKLKFKSAMAGDRFTLPSLLHKTTQLSAAIRKAEPHQASILVHRQKYSAPFEFGGATLDRASNHFLSVKALYNAEKIISKLEAMPESERQRYVEN